ncbi:MAG: hypothetical protein R3C53_22960 [Pirellulaceae bacterium]
MLEELLGDSVSTDQELVDLGLATLTARVSRNSNSAFAIAQPERFDISPHALAPEPASTTSRLAA